MISGTKPLNPNRIEWYLNEKSNDPQHLKDGILRGFLHRNNIVSSTPEAHAKELELLISIFIRDGYDPERVDRIISSWVPKAERGKTTKEDKKTETQGLAVLLRQKKVSQDVSSYQRAYT